MLGIHRAQRYLYLKQSPFPLNWALSINGKETRKKTKQQYCSVVANKDDNWAGKYVFGSAHSQLDNSAKTD